ncbi:DUF998 domain-containing protein [Micromonospora sp. NPDC126480]|uniref:DUF998 domain-containing protein n=1 Tax=Micromonospora sp. NPDC126480 TaxID=3155312 RepID=UPI003321E9DC
MPGSRNSGLLALGGIALAALLAVVGHLGVDGLDPWSLTISDYAVSDRGGAIDAAMVVLAVASALLIAPLSATPSTSGGGAPSEPRAGLVGVLLVTWVGGLLLAAAVPTNEPGLPMDTAAYVHRYASVAAFLALPVAGWSIAGRLPAGATSRWLRRLVIASVALAAAMVWSAYPGDRMLLGLIERLLILIEVGLLATVALQLTRTAPAVWSAAGTERRHSSSCSIS